MMLCVKWHKTGDFFVLGDYGDTDYNYKPLLQFWNSDGTLIKDIDVSRSEYRSLSWTSAGDRLASASDGLGIWTKDGDLIAEGTSEDNLWGVDWSRDGKFIVTSSQNGSIKVWDHEANFIKDLSY